VDDEGFAEEAVEGDQSRWGGKVSAGCPAGGKLGDALLIHASRQLTLSSSTTACCAPAN
jgi:hypothetical protein